MDYLALALAASKKGGGPTPTGEISITSNGVYDVTGFASADVNVSASNFPCLTFSSPNTFKISRRSPTTPHAWEGVVEFSLDLINWLEFQDNTEITSALADNVYYIYMRGMGNTVIGGSSNAHALSIVGTNVSCSGNIMSLLDCRTVSAPSFATLTSQFTFAYLFQGNTSLISAPDLPATKLYSSCYLCMFDGCSNLSVAPALPATTMASEAYEYMFRGCAALTTPPSLPATVLASSCYYGMFYNSGITIAPALSATLTSGCSSCYFSMFSGCSNLTTPPALPSLTLAYSCYNSMFSSSGITTAPALPATTLANSCYNMMFSYCNGLTVAPALPAESVGQDCYHGMFYKCANLTTLSAIGMTTVTGNNACNQMFCDCANLTTVPAVLPPTNLYHSCYAEMFAGCVSLTTLPALPALTVNIYSYRRMFRGCTSLLSLPELPATTLANGCYERMFEGCTGIKVSETQTADCPNAYRIPVSGSGSTGNGSLDAMFQGTGGTFTGTPTIDTTYYTNATIVAAS